MHARVDVGSTVSLAEATVLAGPSLEATTGVTLGGAAIGADGSFSPSSETLTASGTTVPVDVPPATAVLVTAKP